MEFILQHSFPEFDFEYLIFESQRYMKWYDGTDITIIYDNPTSKSCPIGSVEYVVNFYKQHYGVSIKPKNIPKTFLTEPLFLNRQVSFIADFDVNQSEICHVKNNETIKGELDLDNPIGIEVQVSEYISDIESEWRAFVFNNKMVGLHNYSGDFTLMPNVKVIEDMIESYKNEAPISYTLDVMVHNSKTSLVEIHDFFSCGLYGFSDTRIYPIMLYRWFHNFTKNLTFHQ